MSSETLTIRNRPANSERVASPSVISTRGLVGLLIEQVRSEFVKNIRVPAFVVGTVAFPVMLFLLFGLSSSGQVLPEGTSVGAFLLTSFSAYGLIGIALFSFGVGVATERGQGWMKLLRATPMPAWTLFAGKIVMSLLFGALVLALMAAVGTIFAGVRMPALDWLVWGATLLLGALPFSTLGFALGYWAGPNSASPIANLVYLPLSFASGLFVPLSSLPEFLREIAVYLPTYHFGQLAWRTVGTEADLALITGVTGGAVQESVLWLLGAFVVFGVLAVVGYRRDQGRQYG
jgi:ABC-2 type transport system permease protein